MGTGKTGLAIAIPGRTPASSRFNTRPRLKEGRCRRTEKKVQKDRAGQLTSSLGLYTHTHTRMHTHKHTKSFYVEFSMPPTLQELRSNSKGLLSF